MSSKLHCLKALNRVKLDSRIYLIEIVFNLNSQFFSQETYDFQTLRSKSMVVAGYEEIKIYIFHQLAIKLWVDEYDDDDLHANNP